MGGCKGGFRDGGCVDGDDDGGTGNRAVVIVAISAPGHTPDCMGGQVGGRRVGSTRANDSADDI